MGLVTVALRMIHTHPIIIADNKNHHPNANIQLYNSIYAIRIYPENSCGCHIEELVT